MLPDGDIGYIKKKKSSIICLVPGTSWFGRIYLSEPVPFRDSILWEHFCFPLTSCLFKELLTNVGGIVTFLPHVNKYLPQSLSLKYVKFILG